MALLMHVSEEDCVCTQMTSPRRNISQHGLDIWPLSLHLIYSSVSKNSFCQHKE